MLIVAVLLFVLALVVGAVGVAALTGKLPRNRWAGVRTPDALRDDEAFALANKVAAPSMLGSAVLLALGGVASLTLPTVAGIIAVVVTVVAALITAGAGGIRRSAGRCGDEAGGDSRLRYLVRGVQPARGVRADRLTVLPPAVLTPSGAPVRSAVSTRTG